MRDIGGERGGEGMCSRYRPPQTLEEIYEEYALEGEIPYEPPPEIYPQYPAPVIIGHGEGKQLQFMRWGLIPSGSREAKIGRRMLHARAETIAQKPSFREAFRARRCLVPARGFFEWQVTEKAKIPCYIYLKDRKLFSMAGIWEEWRSPEGKRIRTYSVVTTTPNRLIEPIHNRMPVILERGGEAAWLQETSPSRLRSLLKPYRGEDMVVEEL